MKRYSLLFLILVLLLSGCKEQQPSYRWERYSKDELLIIFKENKPLFEQLVDTLVNENFLEKARPDSYSDAFLSSPYGNQMRYLSESGQGIVEDVFDLKPYMISYDCTSQYIYITFIGSDDVGYSFLRWLDAPQDFQQHMKHLGQWYTVEELGGNWCIYYKSSTPLS